MIMWDYEVYNNDPLPGKIKRDLDKIKSLINYQDKEILYRIDKYFVEFIFSDFYFIKENFLYLKRIFKSMINTIRIAPTKEGQLIIVIEKYPEIFVNR